MSKSLAFWEPVITKELVLERLRQPAPGRVCGCGDDPGLLGSGGRLAVSEVQSFGIMEVQDQGVTDAFGQR